MGFRKKWETHLFQCTFQCGLSKNIHIHIHIQTQTLKSNISKTGQDREKVSMEVR